MQLTIDASGRRRCRATKTEQAKLVAACGVLAAYNHCTDSLAAQDAKISIERVLIEMDGRTDDTANITGDESHDGATESDDPNTAPAAGDNQPAPRRQPTR